MSDSIDLSVVIVTYKSKEYISRCIKSVREATQGLSAEIIIVDNASSDGVIDSMLAEFPEVIAIENEVNEGFARGVNKGAGVASGRYLAILNPDTQLYPDTLKNLLNFLERHPQNCIVGARMFNEKGKIVSSCRSLPHIGNIIKYPILALLRRKRLGKPRRYLLDLWDQNRTIDVIRYNGYITGGCILTELDFFKKMGMLDGQYFLFAEDADFGFRLKRAGFHAFLVSEASLVHLEGRSASQNPRSRLYSVDAYVRYIHKNFTFLHGATYKTLFLLLVFSWTIGRLLRMEWDEIPVLLQALRCFVPYWLGGPPKLREHVP